MARQATAWSVKGVDQATRDIARRASQAAGVTIGEWIDQAIRADAQVHGDSDPAESKADALPTPASSRAIASGRVSLSTVDQLASRLDAADARLDAAMRPIAYALQDIAQRLVAVEQRAELDGPRHRVTAPKALSDARGPEISPAVADPSQAVPSSTDPVWDEQPVQDDAWVRPAESTAPPPYRPAADPPEEEEDDVPDEIALAIERTVAKRRLPEAPPAGWEAAVRINHAELADAADAMQAERAVPDVAPDDVAPDPDPDPVLEPASLLESDAFRLEDLPSDARIPDTQGRQADPAAPEEEHEPEAPTEAAAPVAAVAERAARPDPVPPTADIPPDGSLTGTVDASVPGWLTRPAASERAPLAARAPERARPAPARRRPRRAAWAAVAAVLVIVAAAAGWMAFGGSAAPTVEAMRDRMIETAEVLQAEAESAASAAGAELDYWMARLATVFDTATGEPPQPSTASAPPVEAAPATQPPPTVPAVGAEPAPAVPPAAPPTVAQATPPTAPATPSAAPAPATPVPADAAPDAPVAAPAKPADAAVPGPSSAPVVAAPAVKPSPPPPAPDLQAPVQPEPKSATGQLAALPPALAPAAGADRAALLASARSGDPSAQYTLAAQLASAEPPDFQQAANWFRESAIQGVPNAQYNLGVLYERGLGLPQDDTRALLWYHSAAEQGHPLAQYNLGVLYSAGRGIPLSYAESARWFRRAAERGVPAAAYNLAVLTEGGLGLTRDPAEAERWLRRAAELGHSEAKKRLAAGGLGKSESALDETATTATNDGVAEEDVAAIQRGLSRLGLYDGAVDGIAGPKTRDAISRYQVREGLPANGLPSTSLRKLLGG
ncbi:SEL1-like repeat protein [Thalassobaculum sp.]|uniref:SEL1-like repeat protein n=1 Tax=Thalassobaculum sp. TaxID=2022740 RepID=UPI0032ECACE7